MNTRPANRSRGTCSKRRSPEAGRASEEDLRRRFRSARLDRGLGYDYATREVRHTRDVKDPERIFKNGLAGCAPDLDLCAALVERMLDDGSQQKTLAAFAHAYTDRDGRVYPGVTLYDAWSSGVEIEMPDVDTLGIVHTLLDDWKTWKAPVDASQHDKLYAKIGELYRALHRLQGLRHALAAPT